jgi:hypothetical protein
MGYWSVYVSKEDEKVLKNKIKKIAERHHWSFSQAVSVLLKEHLIEERKPLSEEKNWELLSAQTFFEGYSEKDSLYDAL